MSRKQNLTIHDFMGRKLIEPRTDISFFELAQLRSRIQRGPEWDRINAIYWLFGAPDQKVMQEETAEMNSVSLKTIKRLIHRFNEVGVAGEFWLFRKRGSKRKVTRKVGGLEP